MESLVRRFDVLSDYGKPGGYLLIDPDLSEPDEIAIRLCFVDAEHVTLFVQEEHLREHLMGSGRHDSIGTPRGGLQFWFSEDDLEVSLAAGEWLGHVVEADECGNYLAVTCGLVDAG